jgi:hypothetical protein
LHIEDTYGPGRKNVSGGISGNHMETATPLLMVKMATLLNQGLIGLVKHGQKHGKSLTWSLYRWLKRLVYPGSGALFA